MAGILSDAAAAQQRRRQRGVAVYSPNRPLVRPTGTLANSGTARNVASVGDPSYYSSPEYGRDLQVRFSQPSSGGSPSLGDRARGALGIAANSVPGQVAMRLLDLTDLPRRVAISTGKEAYDLVAGEGASGSDWREQVADPNFGVGQLVPDIDTGNVLFDRWANRGVGFLGDVLLDPTTYIAGSGVIGTAGRGARARLAARIAEAGLGEEMATRVGRYGYTALSDAEREIVRRAVGDGIERGLLKGTEAMLNRGWYWKTPFAEGRLRIPGSGPLEQAIGGAFSRARASRAGQMLYNATLGHLGDEAERALIRRVTTGRGAGSFLEAAELLNVSQTNKVLKRTIKRTIGNQLQQLLSQHSDDELRQMVESTETTGGTAISKLLAQAREVAAAHGVEYHNLPNYMPHYRTPEGRAWMEGMSPEAVEWRKAFGAKATDSIFDDLSPATFERQIKGRPEPYKFRGKEFSIPEGQATISHINAEFRRVTGLDFDLLEADPRKILARYVENLGDDVGKVGAVTRLIRSKSGIVQRHADVVEELTKSLSNKAMREKLGKDVKVATAAAKTIAKDFEDNFTATAGVIAERYKSSLDQLTTVSAARRARLDEAVSALANLDTESSALTDQLDQTIAEVTENLNRIETQRIAFQEAMHARYNEAVADVREAPLRELSEGVTIREEHAQRALALAERESELRADLARLADVREAHAQLLRDRSVAEGVIATRSFLANALPHEQTDATRALLHEPKLSPADLPDDFEISSPANAYQQSAAKRAQTIYAPEQLAETGLDQVPGLSAAFEQMRQVETLLTTKLVPEAIKARERHYTLAAMLSEPLTQARTHLENLREVEAQTEAWLWSMQGHPQYAEQLDEQMLFLDQLRSPEGELGRAQGRYDEMRDQLNGSREAFEQADLAVVKAERQQIDLAYAADQMVDEYRAANPLTALEVPEPLYNETYLKGLRTRHANNQRDLARLEQSQAGRAEAEAVRKERLAARDLARTQRTIDRLGERIGFDDDGEVLLLQPNDRRARDRKFALDEAAERVEASRNAFATATAEVDRAYATARNLEVTGADATDAYRLHREALDRLERAHVTLVDDLRVHTQARNAYASTGSTGWSDRLIETQAQSLRDAIVHRNEQLAYLEETHAWLENMRRQSGLDGVRKRVAATTKMLQNAAERDTEIARTVAANAARGTPAPSSFGDRLNRIRGEQLDLLDMVERQNADYVTEWADVGPREVDVWTLVPMAPHDAVAYEQARDIVRHADAFGGSDSGIVRQAHAAIAELRNRLPPAQAAELANRDALTTLEGQLEELRLLHDTPYDAPPEVKAAVRAPTEVKRRGEQSNLGGKGKTRSARARKAPKTSVRKAKRVHALVGELLKPGGTVEDLIAREAVTPEFGQALREQQRYLDILITARTGDAMPYMNQRLEQTLNDTARMLEYSIRYQRALQAGAPVSDQVGAFVLAHVLYQEGRNVESSIKQLRDRLAPRVLSDEELRLWQRHLDPRDKYRMPEAMAKRITGVARKGEASISGISAEDLRYELNHLRLSDDIERDQQLIAEIVAKYPNKKPRGADKRAVSQALTRVRKNNAELRDMLPPNHGFAEETVDSLMTMMLHDIEELRSDMSDFNHWRQLDSKTNRAMQRYSRMKVTGPLRANDAEVLGAAQVRLAAAIERAETALANGTGDGKVRFRDAGLIERNIEPREAIKLLDDGMIPEPLRPYVEAEIARAQAGAGEIAGSARRMNPADEARFAQGREEARQDWIRMTGLPSSRTPITQARLAAEDAAEAAAVSPFTARIRYRQGTEGAVTTMTIEQAKQFHKGRGLYVRRLQIEAEDSKIITSLLEGELQGQITRTRQAIADTVDPPNYQQMQQTITEVLNRAAAGHRPLHDEEIELVDRSRKRIEAWIDAAGDDPTARMERAARLEPGQPPLTPEELGLLDVEALETAKNYLAKIESTRKKYDRYLWERFDSIDDAVRSPEAYFTDILDGRKTLTQDDLEVLSDVIGSEQAAMANSMMEAFRREFGTTYVPIRSGEITEVLTSAGPLPTGLPSSSKLVGLVERAQVGGGEISVLHVNEAIEEADRLATALIESGDLGEAAGKLQRWAEELTTMLTDERRRAVPDLATMSIDQVERSLRTLIQEFGPSELTSAFRGILSKRARGLGDAIPASTVEEARHEMAKVFARAAEAKAMESRRSLVWLTHALKISLGEDIGISAQLRSIGYEMSTGTIDPGKLRRAIITALEKQGVDLGDTALMKLEQMEVRLARIKMMQRNLGRDVSNSSAALTADQIAKIDAYSATLARRNLTGDDLAAFDQRLAEFVDIVQPNNISTTVDRQVRKLRQQRGRAVDEEAIAELDDRIAALMEGQRPRVPGGPDVAPPVEEAAVPPAVPSAIDNDPQLLAAQARFEEAQARVDQQQALLDAARTPTAGGGAAELPERHPGTPEGMVSRSEIYRVMLARAEAEAAGDTERARELLGQVSDLTEKRWRDEPPESVAAAREAYETLAQHLDEPEDLSGLESTLNDLIVDRDTYRDEVDAIRTRLAETEEPELEPIPEPTDAVLPEPTVDAGPAHPLDALRRFTGADEQLSFDQIEDELAVTKQLFESPNRKITKDMRAELAARIDRLTELRNARVAEGRSAFLAEHSAVARGVHAERVAQEQPPRVAFDPEQLMIHGQPSVRWQQNKPIGLERIHYKAPGGVEEVLEPITARTRPVAGGLRRNTTTGRIADLENQLAPVRSLEQEAFAAEMRMSDEVARSAEQLAALEGRQSEVRSVASERAAAARAATEPQFIPQARAAVGDVKARYELGVEHLQAAAQAQHQRALTAINEHNARLAEIEPETAALLQRVTTLRAADTAGTRIQAGAVAALGSRPNESAVIRIKELMNINDLMRTVSDPAARADLDRVALMLMHGMDQARKLDAARADVTTLKAGLKSFKDDPSKTADVLVNKVRDGWVPLTNTPASVTDKLYVSSSLAHGLRNLDAGLRDQNTWKMLEAYTSFFKTYATMTPGFHLRNLFSGVFMNLVDGVKVSNMNEARSIWRDLTRDPLAFIERNGGWDSRIGRAVAATFGSGASGAFHENAEILSRSNRWLLNNRFTRWNQRAGSYVEGALRLSMALDSIDRGQSVAAAVDRITRYHFDYADIGRLDARMRRLVPFWTYLSRNLPLQIESMFIRPRAYNVYDSFVRNFGEPVDPLTPEYWLNQGAWTLTEGQGEGDNTGSSWYFAPDLPHTRLLENLGGGVPAMLSNLNPAMLAPLEAMGFEEKLYTGQELDSYEAAEGPMALLAPLLERLGRTETGGASGDTLVRESDAHLLRTLIPPLNLIERLTSNSGTRTDRQGETWLRAFGAPVYRLTPTMREQTTRNEYFDRSDEARRRAELARS